MASDPIKVGDVVELKSGGPPMTVTGVYTNLVGSTDIKCIWFFGVRWSGTFSPSVLIPSRPRKFEELKGSYSAPIAIESATDESQLPDKIQGEGRPS